MKVGDLIKYNDLPEQSYGRNTGIILGFDVHHPQSMLDYVPSIRIVEVLWDGHGGPAWIAEERIVKIQSRVQI